MNAVVVIIKGKRAIRKFQDENQGWQFFQLAKEKFGTRNTFLVSLTNHIPPPEGLVLRKKYYWCPYCGDERRFIKDPYGYLKCPVCFISDKDFYTKYYNDKRKNYRQERRPKNGNNLRRVR